MFNLVHSTQQPRPGYFPRTGIKKIIFHLQTEAHLERKKWKKNHVAATCVYSFCYIS